VSKPGSVAWFARHEARLAWRDWLWLMTGGNRRRIRTVVLGFAAFAIFMHGLAWLMLAHSAGPGGAVDRHMLVVITAMLVPAWSLMLSQALESVTRAFFARGDLELILASPAPAVRLFAVRIVAMTVTVVLMSLVLTAPFINVLVWRDGVHWLAAYVAAVALAMIAVGAAVALTVALFRLVGPRRTRSIAQIVAAVIGAAFAIGLQFAAILSYGTLPGAATPRWAVLDAIAPDAGSPIWWPARAVLGQPAPLAALLAFSLLVLGVCIRAFAPRFGQLALSAASVTNSTVTRIGRESRFRTASPARTLRRKEWILLLRDPWLMSQTLMQLLYMLPAALLLWRNFQTGGGVSSLLVPILIVAAGQLGGGLAWLAVSGEDAPDLIGSAPVPAGQILRAKIEAVLSGIAVVFAPFLAVLAVVAPFAALVAFAGVIIAAGSSTAIQYWFRTQAKRSLFRRRQTSSRVATFAEAVASTGWAGTGALAATGTWLAVVPGVLVLAIVAGVWMISPARRPALV
jgi:ABC-2 type transport system permease protein